MKEVAMSSALAAIVVASVGCYGGGGADDGVCSSSADCADPESVCSPEGKCVQCVDDGDCAGAARCDSQRCSGPVDGGMDAEQPRTDGGSTDGGPDGDTRLMDGATDGATTDGETPGDADAGGGPCGPACLCDRAAASGSTAGCEFWPVVTASRDLRAEFAFGVHVVNGEDLPAEVEIRRDTRTVTTATVAAGSSRLIELPRIEELDLSGDMDTSASDLVRDGSYRLTSTVPVSAVQMHGTEGRISMDCADEALNEADDGECFVYTTDATVLWPVHALSTDYTVVSRSTHVVRAEDEGSVTTWTTSPGFVSIVATEASDVTVSSSAHVVASADDTIATMAPGDTSTWSLLAGDVLQLLTAQEQSCSSEDPSETQDFRTYTYCRQGPDYDLTGTTVSATGDVQVIGGHSCTFVPFDRWACDHLETSLLPDSAWGSRFVVGRTTPIDAEPNVVRIVNGGSANTITFSPSSVSAELSLAAGETHELEVSEHVQLEGTTPFAVTQHLVGSAYEGLDSFGESDPSMTIVLPVSAWSGNVAFHAPETFDRHLLVVAPTGARVLLDGTALFGWEAVGSTGTSVARTTVASGFHRLESSDGFAATGYGSAKGSSYLTMLGGAL